MGTGDKTVFNKKALTNLTRKGCLQCKAKLIIKHKRYRLAAFSLASERRPQTRRHIENRVVYIVCETLNIHLRDMSLTMSMASLDAQCVDLACVGGGRVGR